MVIPIEQMPEEARLWIYQSDRHLTDEEVTYVRSQAEEFVSQWAAHGKDLKAGFEVSHNQFLIISVDESFNLASGCSIDASVNLVRKLEQDLGTRFLDRTKVAFLRDEKVSVHSLNEIKELVASGVLEEESLVFNNVVQTVGDWKKSWILPSSQTWLKRYFN